MKTRDCVNHLIEWTNQHYDSLATPAAWDFVGKDRLSILEKGHTRVSNWKRRAVKKNDQVTYRLFECQQTLFPLSTYFLVIEEDDQISDVKAGSLESFENYFNKIGFNWGGWKDV